MYKSGVMTALALGLLIGAGILPASEAAAASVKKVGNYVKVFSCVHNGNGITIQSKNKATPTSLFPGCKNAGHGLRNYAFSCVSNKLYYVSWEPCSATDEARLSSLNVVNQSSGEVLGVAAGSSYQTLKYYAAKQLVAVGDKVNDLKFNAFLTNASSSLNYTYAFGWTDNQKGSTPFNEKLAKTLVSGLTFGATSTSNLTLTDYYRGRFVTLLAFVRDNDGISRVPNMPVEVDDVIAIHVRVLPKSPPPFVCEDKTGGSGVHTLCLNKTFTHSSGAKISYTKLFTNGCVSLKLNNSNEVELMRCPGWEALWFFSPDMKQELNVYSMKINKSSKDVTVTFGVVSQQASVVSQQKP